MRKTKTIDFSLILPCYNEEPIFENNVKHILKVLEQSTLNFEVIFVDDKSKDRTKKLIQKVCKLNPKKVRALYHEKNKGRGATVVDGILAANGVVVGYMDIDCEVSPIYISEIVNLILENSADVVLGKRIYRTTFKSLIREILSFGYQAFANIMLDTDNLDTESGYKFFNRKKIMPLLKYADHNHWFWDTQIVILAKRKGLKIREVPVLFLRRFDKISSVRIFADVWDYCVNIFKFRRQLKRIHLS